MIPDGSPKNFSASNLPSYIFRGTFENANGELQGLMLSDYAPEQSRPYGFYVASLTHVNGYPEGVEQLDWISAETPGPFELSSRPRPSYPLWASATADVIRHIFATASLRFSSYDLSLGIASNYESYPRTGSINVKTFPGGRDITMVSMGGRVEKVTLGDSNLELDLLDDLQAPPGEFVTAAFIHGQKLIAFTQREFTGVDHWYQDVGLDYSVQTDFGQVMMYEADLPSTSQTRTPARLWGVIASRSGRDALVCWAEPASDTSQDWTLGGLPAQATLSADGHCVILARDRSGGAETHTDWLVEGSLPGGGRVLIAGLRDRRDWWPFAIGMTRSRAQGVTPEVWSPTTDGYVGREGSVMDAQLSYGRPNTRMVDFLRPKGFGGIDKTGVDAAGGGLWIARFGVALGDTDLLLARISDGVVLAKVDPKDVLRDLKTNCQGGGALVILSKQPEQTNVLHYISADGTATQVATPSHSHRLSTQRWPNVRRRGWRACVHGHERYLGQPWGSGGRCQHSALWCQSVLADLRRQS